VAMKMSKISSQCWEPLGACLSRGRCVGPILLFYGRLSRGRSRWAEDQFDFRRQASPARACYENWVVPLGLESLVPLPPSAKVARPFVAGLWQLCLTSSGSALLP